MSRCRGGTASRERLSAPRAGLPLDSRAQQRKLEPREVDQANLMTGLFSALLVGLGQRISQMTTARIRVALDDGDPSGGHGRVALPRGNTIVRTGVLIVLMHVNGHCCTAENPGQIAGVEPGTMKKDAGRPGKIIKATGMQPD